MSSRILCAPIPSSSLCFHPCPLCGQVGGKIIARRGFPGIPLRNVICKNCGLIRIDPRPNDEWYQQFYQHDFFTYLRPYERAAYVEELEHTTDPNYQTPVRRTVLPFFWDYVPDNGHILDIGAGFGQIVYHLREGKHVTFVGLEPNPECHAIAHEKFNLEFLTDTVEEYFVDNHDKFDFVVMDQLFEHLLQPLDILAKVAKRLNPRGVIYLSVPNAWNPQALMSHFYQVAHTYNYTPYTLGRIAEHCGLRIVKITPADVHPIRVILALPSGLWPAVSPAALEAGADWRVVARRLRRKQALNLVRGKLKWLGDILLGSKLTQQLQEWFDRLVHYRY